MTLQNLTPAEIIAHERIELVNTLSQAQSSDPTLCEGWECRHLLAHLILRETEVLIAAGVLGGPLGKRTEKVTNFRAEGLSDRAAYEHALDRFAHLNGYFKMHTLFPQADVKMNLIEYFVHIEDVRRAGEGWEPRSLPHSVQQAIWDNLRSRAKMMAGKNYPHGLVLQAPGFVDMSLTVVEPAQSSIPATVLTGEPGELVLYLFGREEMAKVEVS